MIINRGIMNVSGGNVAVYTVIRNEGTLNVNSGNNGLEYDFDNVSFHGIELVGTIPLNPRVIIFLESKGNTIIQNNERITFHGDLVNAFTENEVTEFLATAEPAVSKPRPQL